MCNLTVLPDTHRIVYLYCFSNFISTSFLFFVCYCYLSGFGTLHHVIDSTQTLPLLSKNEIKLKYTETCYISALLKHIKCLCHLCLHSRWVKKKIVLVLYDYGGKIENVVDIDTLWYQISHHCVFSIKWMQTHIAAVCHCMRPCLYKCEPFRPSHSNWTGQWSTSTY